MSERGSGVGSFLLGVTVGVVLGLLYAPRAGDATRAKVGRTLRDLRELAGEKAEDLRELLEDGSGGEAGGEGDDDAELEPREELERRLAEARRRRRAARPSKRSAEVESEGDEPVA